MTHKRKRRAKAAPRRRPAKRNPAKPLKRLNKSTGWMKLGTSPFFQVLWDHIDRVILHATGMHMASVKIRRNKGKYEVLIRRSKPRRKAATKRPARRKTTRRRR